MCGLGRGLLCVVLLVLVWGEVCVWGGGGGALTGVVRVAGSTVSLVHCCL